MEDRRLLSSQETAVELEHEVATIAREFREGFEAFAARFRETLEQGVEGTRYEVTVRTADGRVVALGAIRAVDMITTPETLDRAGRPCQRRPAGEGHGHRMGFV